MNVPTYQGVSQIAHNYEAFIIGLRGVIVGNNNIDNAKNVLEELRRNNKKVILLTNSAGRSGLLEQSLIVQGVDRASYLGILSAGEILHFEFKNKTNEEFNSLGYNYFLMGPNSDPEIFEGLHYERVRDVTLADFILVTGPAFEFEDVDTYVAFLNACLERNLPMVACGHDRISMNANKIIIGAGSIANQYQKLGGRVIFRGKPDKDVFLYCREAFPDTPLDKIAVIGDSFDTDIVGANNVNMDAFLITNGIHARELGVNANSIFPDAERINDLARINGAFPKGALEAFVW